ncbi:hypothetical protein FAIPA1_520022 [Frankia sp. AiPs1]
MTEEWLPDHGAVRVEEYDTTRTPGAGLVIAWEYRTRIELGSGGEFTGIMKPSCLSSVTYRGRISFLHSGNAYVGFVKLLTWLATGVTQLYAGDREAVD